MGMRGPYRRKTIAERFWPKVNKTDGCWEWTGSRHPDGAGQLQAPGSPQHGRGSPLHAPRVSWELHYGPIPEGLWVLHRCDNRPCVRPDHLFLGTHDDNMRDMADKGRTGNRKLTAEQVSEMRRLYTTGVGAYRLSRLFGLNKRTVQHIIRGVHYREVA